MLPLSPALSRESILASKLGLKPQFFRRQRAVQPRFDTRADWEILCGLASRLGLDKLAFSRIEDIWNYQLEGTGLGIEAFDATGFVPLAPAPRWKTLAEATLPTPSGKIGPQPLMGRIRARHPAALHGTGAACRARPVPRHSRPGGIAYAGQHDEQPPAVRTRAHQYVMDPHGTGPGPWHCRWRLG